MKKNKKQKKGKMRGREREEGMRDVKLEEIYQNISFENLKSKYSDLVDGNVTWVKTKNSLIGIFIILALYSAFFDAFNFNNLPLSNKEYTPSVLELIFVPIISLIAVHITAIMLHMIVAIITLLEVRGTKELAEIKNRWEKNGTNKIMRFLNVIAFVVKKIPKEVSSILKEKFGINKLIKLLIMPDYLWAEYFKRKIGRAIIDESLITPYYVEYIRLTKKFYIERCNWFNIIVTIIIAIICFVSFSKEPILYGFLPSFACVFILYRTMSRVLEILVSFYYDIVNQREKIFYFFEDGCKTIHHDAVKDIANNQVIKTSIKNKSFAYFSPWNNTLLLPASRASLALHSLLEVTIIFSVLYFLLSGLSHYLPSYWFHPSIEQGKFGDIGVMKFVLFSFSVAITFPDLKLDSYWSILVALQMLVSLVLIIMSLAYYLGRGYGMQKHEKEIYASKKLKDFTR